EQAATLAPDLQFMLAGPRFVDVSRLRSMRNVRLLDAISHEEVMQYMVRFDVGILPYSLNPFTAGIMPAKLKEYLAAGLPIVATPLPEVLRFAARHPGLVAVADNPSQFVSGLRTALAGDSPEDVERRITIAREYDWKSQMERMISWIDQALERTHPSS